MPRSKKTTIQSNPLKTIPISINQKEPKVVVRKKSVASKSVAAKEKKVSIAPKKKLAASVAKKTAIIPSPSLQLVNDDLTDIDLSQPEMPKKEMAIAVIKKWSKLAGILVIAPLPFLATSTTTSFQIMMVRDLCKIYEVPFHKELVKATVSSLVSSGVGIFTASFIAKELLKGIPYLGTAFLVVTQPAIAYKITESLGEVFRRHFEKNGDLTNIDLQASKKLIKL